MLYPRHGAPVRPGHLTERDKSANDIREAFNRLTPRGLDEWPVTVPRPLHDEQAHNLEHPLHPIQRHFIELVDGVEGKPELHQHEITTVKDAMQFLHTQKQGSARHVAPKI